MVNQTHSDGTVEAGESRFVTAMLGFFCQTLLATSYENRTNLRNSETGNIEGSPTRKHSRPTFHALSRWLIDNGLLDLHSSLFTEKSSHSQLCSGVLRYPDKCSFSRKLNPNPALPRDTWDVGIKIRAAMEERDFAILNKTWISAGPINKSSKQNGKQHKSIRWSNIRHAKS